jgi:hypothetical protein
MRKNAPLPERERIATNDIWRKNMKKGKGTKGICERKGKKEERES